MKVAASRRVAMCLGVAAAALVLGGPARAADEAAAALIKKVSAEVIELIKKTKGAERDAGIRKVLESDFDLPAMGQQALATYWDGLDQDLRQRFLKAATGVEARAYSDRFGEYGGQTVDVGRVITTASGVMKVDSKLNQTNGQPIKVEWEVRQSGAALRITDVKVEGVSMVMTRRSDYNSYIQSHGGKVKPVDGVEALVKELESRAAR